jgi:hypothetical protein
LTYQLSTSLPFQGHELALRLPQGGHREFASHRAIHFLWIKTAICSTDWKSVSQIFRFAGDFFAPFGQLDSFPVLATHTIQKISGLADRDIVAC